MNRLIDETSPYLLQHAHNPVDWYPWGPEALERAKSEGKPILLSIGYAACHWCHVMERESFEDDETAAYMNEHFVSIKVDREERPEIDAIYMDAVQVMTGHGGWPMTMFLTPDGKPFYGGTYFPPDDRQGMPSFRRVLEAVVEAWTSRKEEIERQGDQLVEHIATQSRPPSSAEPLTSTLLAQGAAGIGSAFDKTFGGFAGSGGAPKFPQAPVLEFMIRSAVRTEVAREMVQLTLTKMALGGIYDQIGGGFHRYAVDAEWLVPHFEKMLYDNAQLARVYTHAWQAWKDNLYSRIATETLEYLLSEMRAETGAFHSSEDADSQGVEGKFYVWSYAEFMQIAASASSYYGVTQEGNFEGSNILTASGPEPPTQERLALLEARSSRTRPGRDDKILVSWNGLAIAALAEAGSAFGRPDFINAAESAAGFLLDKVRSEEGRLLHNYKGGRATVLGLLEDYAYLSDGLFCLWEATFEPRWAKECLALLEQAIELFWDSDGGGFFTTGSDHERLILRQKEMIESAAPSPAAVLSLVLQKAAVLTGSADWARMGTEVLRLSRVYMERAPQAVATHLSALDFYLSTPKEIVIVGEAISRRTLLDRVFREFIPNRVLAGSPPGIESPMLEGKTPPPEANGAARAYVCENYACQSPTTDPEELLEQLR